MSINFKEDLEKAKILLNCSYDDLALDIGISRSTLYRWINNNVNPGLLALNKVYSYLYKKNVKLNLIDEELYKTKNNKDNIILFHGSKEGISGDLTIEKGNAKKDFGKGFYVGESVKQAISFVSNFPESKLYIIEVKNASKLKIKEFDVSKEWMILVEYFRGKIDEYKESKYLINILDSIKDCDVIIAPIADNSMYSIINEFIEGYITDEQCINSLSANRLGKQYVFLNDNVLKNNVKILKECFICDEERKQYEEDKINDKNLGKAKMILARRQYAGVGKYIEDFLK